MSQQVQASHYLCLDILLAFIDHMAKRMDVGVVHWSPVSNILNNGLQSSKDWPSVRARSLLNGGCVEEVNISGTPTGTRFIGQEINQESRFYWRRTLQC